MIDTVGFLAGILTSGSALPQVLKSWRTRSTDDLSSVMLAMLNIGLVLWVVYGIVRHDWPITLTNAFSLSLWSSLFWLKRQREKG